MGTTEARLLFTPVQLGPMRLKHRVVMAPLTRSRSIQPDSIPGELMAEWGRGIPMGGAGSGEDVAGLGTFLVSNEASYITGQTIHVDGGLMMS